MDHVPPKDRAHGSGSSFCRQAVLRILPARVIGYVRRRSGAGAFMKWQAVILLGLAVSVSGCSVIGAAADVTGAAVSATADVVGSTAQAGAAVVKGAAQTVAGSGSSSTSTHK
jgi:hypothetical protein